MAVIPAEAGIQPVCLPLACRNVRFVETNRQFVARNAVYRWIPASAGMTRELITGV
jgi:hypothetical protein